MMVTNISAQRPQPRDFGATLVAKVGDALVAERAAIQAHLEEYHQTVIRLVEAELQKCDASRIQDAPNEEGVAFSVNKNDVGFVENLSTEPVVDEVSPAWNSADDDDYEGLPNTKSLVFSEAWKLHGALRAIVDSAWFEAFFVMIILLNTSISALQAQYDGFDIGYDIGFPGVNDTAANTWPSAKEVFKTLEILFAVMYTAELALKLAAYRCHFWMNPWNVFDSLVVILWYMTEVMGASRGNPTILRLCRLARLMRLVRHIGWFEACDSLHMLIRAIKSSFPVLVWSSLLLIVLLVMFALVMNGLLGDFLDPSISDSKALDQAVEREGRAKVYTYFGTFTRSFVSGFEISFGGSFTICRAIMENVGEEYAVLILLYKCVVGLSVTKVITGVFLHETFKVCSSDDELMVTQRRRTRTAHVKKMEKLFKKADTNADGHISLAEFEKIMENDWVHMWLSAMELHATDVKRLWTLLADGDEKLTANELIKGVEKLKGGAKSVDMNHLSEEVDQIKDEVHDMHSKVGAMQKDMAIHLDTKFTFRNKSWC